MTGVYNGYLRFQRIKWSVLFFSNIPKSYGDLGGICVVTVLYEFPEGNVVPCNKMVSKLAQQ
jgi:hypothetical protein